MTVFVCVFIQDLIILELLMCMFCLSSEDLVKFASELLSHWQKLEVSTVYPFKKG